MRSILATNPSPSLGDICGSPFVDGGTVRLDCVHLLALVSGAHPLHVLAHCRRHRQRVCFSAVSLVYGIILDSRIEPNNIRSRYNFQKFGMDYAEDVLRQHANTIRCGSTSDSSASGSTSWHGRHKKSGDDSAADEKQQHDMMDDDVATTRIHGC